MVRHLRRHWPLILILISFIGLASIYSVTTPLFEAPDEIWHYEYVRWLVEGKGLPEPADVGVAPWAQEGSQPPLYYGLAAVITAGIPTDNADAVIRYNPHAIVGNADAHGNKNMMAHGAAESWPWRGVALAAHLTRFVSILLGALTVLCTYGLARVAAPGWLAVAPLAASLVAFNPQFLFISSSVSNDPLVSAFSAAGLWLCAALVAQAKPAGWPWWMLLGTIVGLAALSKVSGLLVAIMASLTWMIAAVRARSVQAAVKSAFAVALAALLVAGWWYWRNWQLWGDPLALSVMFAVLPGRTQPAGIDQILAMAPGIWRSYWAVFGWMNVVTDTWIFWLFSALAVIGAIGWVIGWLLQRPALRASLRPLPLLLMVSWVGAVGLALLRWAQISYAQGRLLFPAATALGGLLAIGLVAWWPRRQAALAVAVAATMFCIALLAPWLWIAPAYAPPLPLPAGTAIPNAMEVPFGEAISLVGYSLEPAEIRPGESISVNLYWRTNVSISTNLSVFVHATDELDILQAQRDSFPGSGILPTTTWEPGNTYVDRHRLLVPATVHAPARLRVDVGMYDAGTGQRLPIDHRDQLTLGQVFVAPVEGGSGLPNATEINFDDKLELVGYSYEPRLLHPGDSLELTLWWEVLNPMMQDYVVFTHLMLPPDAVWAQQDQMPQGGTARTSTLTVGQRIEDSYTLTLPFEAPAGTYAIEIGVYDKDTHDRLPVDFSDKGIVLGLVRVVEP